MNKFLIDVSIENVTGNGRKVVAKFDHLVLANGYARILSGFNLGRMVYVTDHETGEESNLINGLEDN